MISYITEDILDKKTLFIVFQKIIHALTGVILIFLVILFFDEQTQGYYYTMSSLLASHVLFDLGFSSLLVQKSSIFYAKSIRSYWLFFTWCIKTYIKLTFLILLLVPLGFFYFEKTFVINHYQYWIISVLVVAISFIFQALIQVIEAKNLIQAYKARIFAHVFGILLSFYLFTVGFGLLSLISLPLGFIISGSYLLIHYKKFYRNLFFQKKLINWKKEIFPYQKKVSLFFIGYYLIFNLPTLISYHIFGAAVAGKIGLIFIISNVILSLSISPVISIIPKYTKSIIKNKFNKSIKKFKDKFILSLYLSVSALICLIILNYLILSLNLSERFLNIEQNILIFISVFFLYYSNLFTFFCRAFQKEIIHKNIIIVSIIYFLIYFFVLDNNINENLILHFLLSLILFIISFMKTKKILHEKNINLRYFYKSK